jgi:hypothetical protein
MYHRIYLQLVPITWSQTLTHDGATVLRARVKCSPHANCDLKLRTGEKLTQYEIELTILTGEIQPDDRNKYRLTEDAIGGLWFDDDEDTDAMVQGWFFINTSVYGDLWEQVRQGGYTGCMFSLQVWPVEGEELEEDDGTWSANPLSIIGASIDFNRKLPVDDANQRPARKGWFSR